MIPISVITNESGTCTEFRINPHFAFFSDKFQKPAGKKNVLSGDFQKITNHTLQNQLKKQCTDHGIEIKQEEMYELILFQEFMAGHIKYNTARFVQCMFLWAEWVRFYKKHTKDFPRLILEKGFRDLVIHYFNPYTAEDDFLGSVYTGITFVP